MDLKFNGVCSHEDFNFLVESKVEYISFDFRTLSPTFIQLYKVCDILIHNAYGGHIILIFDNDKEFVINEVYKKVCESYDSSRVIIEFSGLENYDVLARVDVKYILNYHQALDINLINTNNLFALKLSYLELIAPSGLKSLTSILKNFGHVDICIDANWDDDLTVSSLDYPQIQFIAMSLNDKVQKSFRVIDHEKVLHFLKFSQEIFIKE